MEAVLGIHLCPAPGRVLVTGTEDEHSGVSVTTGVKGSVTSVPGAGWHSSDGKEGAPSPEADEETGEDREPESGVKAGKSSVESARLW